MLLISSCFHMLFELVGSLQLLYIENMHILKQEQIQLEL